MLGARFEQWVFTQALAEVLKLHRGAWRVTDHGRYKDGVLVHCWTVVDASGEGLSFGTITREVADEIVERAAAGLTEGVSQEAVNCLLLALQHAEYLRASEGLDHATHPEHTLLNLANGGSWPVRPDGLYSLFDIDPARRIIAFGPRAGDQMAIDCLRQRLRTVWESQPYVHGNTRAINR